MPIDDVSESCAALEQLVRQAGALAFGQFRRLACDSIQFKGHLLRPRTGYMKLAECGESGRI